MVKKQKRFTSEAALLKAIDAEEAKREALLEKARQLENHIRSMAMMRDTYSNADINWKRREVNAVRRLVERSTNKKIALGKALATFRTKLLPMGIEDNSVVL